jgi:RNA polymerase sigma-70 factor (ECF subfamily)
VLDSLKLAERLAFVLHDMFPVPFDEIAPIVGCSSVAARQLASRARRRVQGATPPDPDLDRQREVVDAFLAAARRRLRCAPRGARSGCRAPRGPRRRSRGPFEDPPRGRGSRRGSAQLLAARAVREPAPVNGAARLVAVPDGKPFSVLGFTGGKIVEIDILADPDRLSQLDLT